MSSNARINIDAFNQEATPDEERIHLSTDPFDLFFVQSSQAFAHKQVGAPAYVSSK
jgi:hypothetical protein